MIQLNTIKVLKADGTQELFDPRKLLRSLEKSGATKAEAEATLAHIESELSDGISTEHIYRHAHTLLKKQVPSSVVARYSLRRALFNLGPTGFPFEDFLARLYHADGYTTHVGTTVQGTCVPHEVDLIAHKEGHCVIAEAKFHSSTGIRSDLRVALYSHARFQDLDGRPLISGTSCTDVETYVITNTKFTKTALDYASCVGMRMLSWNYPEGDTLQNRIERTHTYPITTLTILSVREKRLLLENGILLCTDLGSKRDTLRTLGFSARKIENIVSEGVKLCTTT